MMQVDARPEASTTELVREAIAEAKELIQLEVALARDEIDQEMKRAKTCAVALGTAAAALMIGVTMILVAIALAISRGPIPALVIGLALIAFAIFAGVLGYGRVPKKPFSRTRVRLETDARLLKEHVA